MKDPFETIAAKFRCGCDFADYAVVLRSEWDALAHHMQTWSREKLHEIECLRGQGSLNDACRWTFDDNEFAPMWEGECGAAWCFIDGGPVENDMHYCPNCGRRCVPQAVKESLTTGTDNDGNPLPAREGER